VPSEKSDVRILAAMSDRNSGVSRAGNRRRHPRNYNEGETCRRERLRLFPSPTKQKRIASLESHDLLSFARFLDKKRVNFVLSERVRARLLSGEDQLRAVGRPAQHFRVAEIVVNNDVGVLDGFFRPQRQQPDITRSGPHEEAFPFIRCLSH
jgi:hypothetical protein